MKLFLTTLLLLSLSFNAHSKDLPELILDEALNHSDCLYYKNQKKCSKYKKRSSKNKVRLLIKSKIRGLFKDK